MLRKLSCWLSGFHCNWQTEHTREYTRGAYGLFVGVQPPQVKVVAHYKMCTRCGKTKCVERMMGPA